MKPKISLCMIVLNEEKFIGRALKNVSPYVDEIIVVDGGSKDKTVEIAQKHADHVFFKQWLEDYASQRNFAISKARGEWVLFIDADEIYEDRLLKSLKRFIGNDFGIDAFAFPRKNFINGKQTSAYPDRQLRLFLNNKKIKYAGRIHEIPKGWKFLANPVNVHIIHKKTSARQTRQSQYYNYLSKKYKLTKHLNHYKSLVQFRTVKTQ